MIGLVPVDLPPRDPRFVHGPAESCQLAVDWDGKPLENDVPFAAEHKIDGVRMLYINGQILSREALPLECAGHLLGDLQRLEYRFGKPMMFDGEFIVADSFIATLSAVSSRKPGNGGAMIFDAIPMAAWNVGRDERTWATRRIVLEAALEGGKLGGLELPSFRAVPADLVQATAEFIWNLGGEGLMLKDPTSPYVRGRSRAWQKVKKLLSLECIARESIMGGAALTVEYQGRKLRCTVPVNLRNDVEAAIGQTVIVEAMEFTERGALRHGRLAHIPPVF